MYHRCFLAYGYARFEFPSGLSSCEIENFCCFCLDDFSPPLIFCSKVQDFLLLLSF